MFPVLFHIGNVTVYSFGLLLALGIILGGVLIAILARRYRLPIKTLFDDLLFILFCGVIGSRVLYAIIYPSYFHAPDGNFWQVFALWQGGLIYYGAIIGGLLGAWYVFKNEKANFYRWLDLLVFGLLVGTLFGQTGCLLGGCSVGIYLDKGFTIDNRFPAQLFEAVWSLLLLVLGMVAYIRSARWRFGGRIFLFGSWLMFAGKFILDIWRESSFRWHGVSYLVLADLLILIIITCWIVLRALKSRKMGHELV
jgi:phosphatidylglycerol:prolipoprotein diacylglycerol transferase